MPETDAPIAGDATNVALTQRSIGPPYRRSAVNIQGNENPMKALGFDSAGILRTLSAAEMIADDPQDAKDALGSIGLNDMAPLDQGKLIGRSSTGTGSPEAVSVSQMIALDPTAAKDALGDIGLGDMAILSQGKVIGRKSTGPGTPEAVTVAEMIALDPAAARDALELEAAPVTQAELDAEAATRAAADAALSGRVTVLEDEPVEVTQAELDAEAAARIAADSSLTTALNSETSSRTAGDNANATAISNETSARTAADTTLSGRITVLEAAPVEVTQAELDAEITARSSGDSANATAISNEASARTAADATLSSRVTVLEAAPPAEVTQAELDAETSARTAGDSANATAISNEMSARTAADSTLSGRVTALETAPPGSGEVTQAELDAEVAARTAADAALSGRVTVLEENAFTVVNTDAQFNAALAVGRSMRLLGEGTGGVVNLTTSKDLVHNHMVIEGPAILRSTLVSGGADDPQNRGLVINANDITLRNFKFTSGNDPVGTGADVVKGICFNLFANVGHRTKLQDLEVYNWSYCLHKQNDYLYMNPGTTPIFSSDDVLIERCFCHTVSAMAAILTFGFRRLVVRDCRFLNWLTAPPALGYLTSDAFYGGSDWRDCVFENCHFGNTSLMGLELLPRGELSYVHERTRVTGCKSENCDSMGFSLGFGHGFIVEKCVAKNIRWMGFEIGGRVTEHPESLGHPTFLSQALIEGCEVETLRSAVSGLSVNGPVHGFSIDGARDTLIRNNRLRDIKSEMAGADVGIYLLDCQRCSIQGNVLEDCGRTFILAERIYSSDKTGFHEISNNVFRNPAPYPQSSPPHNQRAILVKDQTATIGMHVAYQRMPDSALYYVSELTPGTNAKVMVNGVLIPQGICLIHNGSTDCPGSPCYIMPGNYP